MRQCMLMIATLKNVMYALREQQLFFNYFFCADVQVRGEYPAFIKRYFKEHNIKLAIQEGDLELIKEKHGRLYRL
ncbi:hypothetical protein GCM10020331_063720 [Ectobacillus funiculus]